MRSSSVTDNLTLLNKFHFVNAYLVREDDGYTLVDTMMSAADDVIAAASQSGIEIRRIALTHGHADHAGSLDALKERLGDSVEVLIPELDAKILEGEKVVDGKLRAHGRRSRPRPTLGWGLVTEWAASRSWRALAIHPGTWRSSIRAIDR